MGSYCPNNGPIDSKTYPFDQLKGLPGAFVIHGELDNLTSEELMHEQAEQLRTQGIDTRYMNVPGADHSTAFYQILPDIFHFLPGKS